MFAGEAVRGGEFSWPCLAAASVVNMSSSIAQLRSEVWHARRFVSTQGKHGNSEDVVSGWDAMFLMRSRGQGLCVEVGRAPSQA